MADSMSDSIRLTMSEKYTFQTWLTRASQPWLTLIADHACVALLTAVRFRARSHTQVLSNEHLKLLGMNCPSAIKARARRYQTREAGRRHGSQNRTAATTLQMRGRSAKSPAGELTRIRSRGVHLSDGRGIHRQCLAPSYSHSVD